MTLALVRTCFNRQPATQVPQSLLINLKSICHGPARNLWQQHGGREGLMKRRTTLREDPQVQTVELV